MNPIRPDAAAFQFFAPCPRGLEGVLARELASLGASEAPREVPGGVHFAGDRTLGVQVNIWSRVASRVLLRLAEQPYRNEHELYAFARGIDWHRWFTADQTIRVDVTAIRSPLRSLEFATLRVKDAVCDRFRDEVGRRPSVDTAHPDVRLSVFLTDRLATLYLDLSGEPLFKRGYRAEAGEAPLRENLAAGILALSGWYDSEPLLDPMCGSGTFLIEAALIGWNIAPGINRSFGFERLAGFDPKGLATQRAQARDAERRATRLRIRGSDRAGEVLRAAEDTIRRIGLSAAITLERADALTVRPDAPAGVLVCNPPYGVRLESQEILRAFFPRFGDTLKQHFAGWRCHVLSPEAKLPGLMRLRESKRTPLFNGQIECRLFEFKMVAGRLQAQPAPPQ